MSQPEVQTEALIKDTAKRLFFQKGFLDATTQEIADEAGVNRALIHYYFRSREQLIDTIVDEVLQEKRADIRGIMNSNIPFRQKIATFIDTVVDHGITYPYLENFIITDVARNREKTKFLNAKEKQRSCELIRPELQQEIDAGNIAPVSPEHFMVNLTALCNYPLLARPMLQHLYSMSDTAYRKFLQERKQIIFNTLFHHTEVSQ